jgi:hypothetical protein
MWMRRVNLGAGAPDILYGETPFGWQLSDDRSRLVADTEEQRLVAVVRHMYLSERLPMREIVERLRRMRVVNRRGGPFGLSSVWEMIHRRSEQPAEAKGKARKPVRATAKKRKRA